MLRTRHLYYNIMHTIVSDIQAWYAAQCDGDWEHSFGIAINTLDNPGWSVKINVDGTLLEDKMFARVEQHETEQRWIVCEVKEKKFVGYGGSGQLEEILSLFLDWAKSEPDWLALPCEAGEEAET